MDIRPQSGTCIEDIFPSVVCLFIQCYLLITKFFNFIEVQFINLFLWLVM